MLEHIKVLTFPPHCPFCASRMRYRDPLRYDAPYMVWECRSKECGTVFPTGELIKAINVNIDLINSREEDNET